MVYKTLGLILAAGEGYRVQNVLGEDEPTKAMIKIGDKRLIHKSIHFLEGVVSETAVLSFPSISYESLDKIVQEKGLKVLKQKAKHRKLPTLLELPYILLMQYHLSSDRSYLQDFDSILTMPSDLVFENVDIGRMVDFHNANLKTSHNRQITILSREGTEGGRADMFKIDGYRIIGMRKYEGQKLDGYEVSTQVGIYIFSRGILKHPYWVLLGFNHNDVYRYLTQGSWIDFGNPENVLNLRQGHSGS